MRLLTGTRAGVVGAAFFATAAVAQEPPRPLPPSITGRTPPTLVVPATAVGPAEAPIVRFRDLKQYPPETVQAVYATRAGADWLYRTQQANGRFFPGFNPAQNLPVADDLDLRQAMASVALARAARFTGDPGFTVRATQSVLALRALTTVDDAGVRVPTAPSSVCNRVGFAALLVLAIHALPDADESLTADAERMCMFLKRQVRPDGSIQYTDDPATPAAATEPDGLAVYPGLALQALAVSHRAKPENWKRAAVARGIGHYQVVFRGKPNAHLAATVLPAVTEFFLQGKDAGAAAAGFEFADHLCGRQYTAADAPKAGWTGSFRPDAGAEPGVDATDFAAALASAARLTRNVPDTTRYLKYRQAAVDGLQFARGLQYGPDTSTRATPEFRARFLTGGVCPAPSDPTVRPDCTARLVLAHLAFLGSGAERRPE